MRTFPRIILLGLSAALISCATTSEQQIQADVRSLSTNELLDRAQRLIAESETMTLVRISESRAG
jgi:hypothetical protein